MKKQTKTTTYADTYERLLMYCRVQGWEVRSASEAKAEPEENWVSVVTSHSKEIMCYTLLHEIGHMLNAQREDYDTRYYGFKYKPSNVKHRVSCIEEEIDAWNQGEALALTLNINIDREVWQRHRTLCLNSHFRNLMGRKRAA